MEKRLLIGLLVGLWIAGCHLVSCTDDSLADNTADEGSADGISFNLSVVEQEEILYEYGKTRAADGEPFLDSMTIAANTFSSHPLGEQDLYVHRMVLPFMGIHPRTVGGSNVEDRETRASTDDIIGADIRDFHDSLTIWGYAYNTDTPYSAEEPYKRTLFNQILLKKIRGWRSSVHWPYDEGKAKYMRFYAVAPSMENMEITLKNTPAYDTPPQIEFLVPDKPDEQRDLLYGYSAEINVPDGPSGAGRYPSASTPKEQHLGDDDKTVGLTFNHLLTAVRFAQGNMPTNVTIKGITLDQIKNKGIYTALTGGSGTWSGQEGTAEYEVEFEYDVTEYAPTNSYLGNKLVLFLLPQTLTSTQTLSVSLLKDGESTPRTLTCNLDKDIWKAGYTVTYKITIGELKDEYYLLVEPESSYQTDDGKVTPVHNTVAGADGSTTTYYQRGSDSYEQNTAAKQSGSFRIHSFRNYKDYTTAATGTNKHHAVGWKVLGFATPKDVGFVDYTTATYTLNNTNAVSWLSSFADWDASTKSSSEQVGTTGSYTTVNYEMNEQTVDYNGNHATIIFGNNPVNLNLSTRLPDGSSGDGAKMSGYTGTGEYDIYHSANSYIVNAQGSYYFPIVYGNAYNAGASDINNPGNIFLDHSGHPIAYANILQQVNSYTPTSTEINSDITTTESESYSIVKKTREEKPTYGLSSSSDITVELLWQDYYDETQTDAAGKSLFTTPDFKLNPTTSTIGFITFGVTSNAAIIRPGNCVIALKAKKRTQTTIRVYKSDETEYIGTIGETTYPYTTYGAELSTDILWAWHIWLTDEVYPNASPETTDVHYPSYDSSTASKVVKLYNSDNTETGNSILPVNLGWVPDNLEWNKYESREIWVKIAQTEPNTSDFSQNKVIYLKLRQEAQQDRVTGTSTIYQWGRPTALPMKTKIDGSTTREFYSTDGTNPTINSSSISTADAAITTPLSMAIGWNPTAAYWGATKSLYDPCPPRFQLPASSVFTPFSLTGATATNDATNNYLNMWSNEGESGKGGYFWPIAHTSLTGINRDGVKVYIPATGTWSDSYVQANRTAGYYWTDTQGKTWQVLPTTSSDGFIKFDESLGTGYALPIRPVASP